MVASVTLVVLVLSASGWLVVLGAIAVLWVPAIWALYRSLSDEDRKLELLDEQGEIDTYSPGALAELREWVESNPEDPLAEEGRKRYNDCVEILRRIDETFYDWSESEIDSLEKL
jgi:hypothetical protein